MHCTMPESLQYKLIYCDGCRGQRVVQSWTWNSQASDSWLSVVRPVILEFQPLQLCLAIHPFSDAKYCRLSFSKGHMLKDIGTS